MVEDNAFSHISVTIFKEILNPEGHPNGITGSKVTAILLNGWTLPNGGVLAVRVCVCIAHTNFLPAGIDTTTQHWGCLVCVGVIADVVHCICLDVY